MKIGIIGYSARKISPYLQFYMDYLSYKQIEYDFITREITREYLDAIILDNQYVIECANRENKIGKIIDTIRWIKKVKSIIKSQKYDKLILLTGYPAFLLSDFVTKKYKSKYIVDIRDYMPLFGNPIVSHRLKASLRMASFNVISSDGFRNWMPTLDRVYTIHNCPDIVPDKKEFTMKSSGTITIGFLGVISYLDNNLRLMDYFSNEKSFKLYYAGVYDKDNTLQNYAKDNGIKNVTFDGPFDNKKKEELYSNVDLINAIYGSESITVTSALPNKLYDAILYRKPIIVSKHTFLASIVERYSLGISIDISCNPVDEINNYICTFDEEKFVKGAEEFLDICLRDNKLIQEKLDVFVRDEVES